VLRRETPPRIVFAPNFWQWFAHQKNHGRLPPELAHCHTQLDMLRYLGVDVFSRNLYCDQRHAWAFGLAKEVWDGVEFSERRDPQGPDTLIEKTYRTRRGTLRETLRYLAAESTLVQRRFLVEDFQRQLDAFEAWVRGRRWRFDADRYRRLAGEVGEAGLLVAGELFSPLKMLHFTVGAVNAVYLLTDHPERTRELLAAHEEAQLDLVRQMAAAGVPAMMSMDNLDTQFHTPAYVERCSASFYEQASRICHQAGAVLLIHACGRQKKILPLVAGLGVDGLEGVAYPPLGDVELDEALRLTGDRFLITGGVSALETERFSSRQEVRAYLQALFSHVRPYAHRFILASSCNTSIRTPWQTILWFRDAWRELAVN
jgi:hypothetical protein